MAVAGRLVSEHASPRFGLRPAIPRNPYQRDKLSGIDIRADPVDDPAIEVRVASLSTDPIPYPDNSFDSLSAYDFLEHVPRVSLDYATRKSHFPFVALMSEIWRVLKPGGLLCATTPCYPHQLAFADPTHVNIISPKTVGYFCGAEPMARIYGFVGSYELVRQKKMRTRSGMDYLAANPSAKPRVKILADKIVRGEGHMLWEMWTVK